MIRKINYLCNKFTLIIENFIPINRFLKSDSFNNFTIDIKYDYSKNNSNTKGGK